MESNQRRFVARSRGGARRRLHKRHQALVDGDRQLPCNCAVRHTQWHSHWSRRHQTLRKRQACVCFVCVYFVPVVPVTTYVAAHRELVIRRKGQTCYTVFGLLRPSQIKTILAVCNVLFMQCDTHRETHSQTCIQAVLQSSADSTIPSVDI